MVHFVNNKVSYKIAHICIVGVVCLITEPNYSFTDHIQQFRDVFEGSCLVPVDDVLLTLETGIDVEPSQLAVTVRGGPSAEHCKRQMYNSWSVLVNYFLMVLCRVHKSILRIVKTVRINL